MNIENQRIEIDEIDLQIIRLLNRRAKLAIEIGTLKKKSGAAIFDAERECKVIEQIQLANTGPLGKQAINNIFRQIIRESRRVATQASAK